MSRTPARVRKANGDRARRRHLDSVAASVQLQGVANAVDRGMSEQTNVVSSDNLNFCASCNKPFIFLNDYNNNNHLCPCKTTRYCNTACQKAHWREHKTKHREIVKKDASMKYTGSIKKKPDNKPSPVQISFGSDDTSSSIKKKRHSLCCVTCRLKYTNQTKHRFRRCAMCCELDAVFCSRLCQEKAWPGHREECISLGIIHHGYDVPQKNVYGVTDKKMEQIKRTKINNFMKKYGLNSRYYVAEYLICSHWDIEMATILYEEELGRYMDKKFACLEDFSLDEHLVTIVLELQKKNIERTKDLKMVGRHPNQPDKLDVFLWYQDMEKLVRSAIQKSIDRDLTESLFNKFMKSCCDTNQTMECLIALDHEMYCATNTYHMRNFFQAYQIKNVDENKPKTKKQKPNDRCACGSNKKYKKCCGSKKR